jgi:ubiquinone/menaquinone biosynthesis C-methylase UbiE
VSAPLTWQGVNENHAALCSSPEWAHYLQTDVLTPLLRDVDLGQRMIEVGPGPGATTSWLRDRVGSLVAVEADPTAARALADRFTGSNLEVIVGDASQLPDRVGSFDAAGSFTMLHHVPTRARQRAVLAELVRVLRPGGVLVGSDSLASDDLRAFHEGDIYNPLPPAQLLTWLQELDCRPITVGVADVLTFVAHKPQRENSAANDTEAGITG